MLRIIAVAVFALVALTFSGTASAQQPQPDVPVPAADEIVFTGEVPVAPGTANTPGPVGGISAGGELRPLSVQTADESQAGYVAAAILFGFVAVAATVGAARYIRRR